MTMTENIFAAKEIGMFETVATNGAAILTLIAVWSTLVWMVTYLYMDLKLKQKDQVIEVLDYYIESVERDFGHVMDDYTDYYLTDKGMEAL
jgi:hypothetical protein